ncbi:MAG: hypothetical protein HY785_11985 [Oscillatoriophycideae cyanobacterium NC_groundwater_1537_Pr4_S-0.65um_50_18]|nr:hypothetical protein [Oscillatoriophycideae cyanobacterium NC_groundwater_1537_Pr4_S-0.65um_50_18]
MFPFTPHTTLRLDYCSGGSYFLENFEERLELVLAWWLIFTADWLQTLRKINNRRTTLFRSCSQ